MEGGGLGEGAACYLMQHIHGKHLCGVEKGGQDIGRWSYSTRGSFQRGDEGAKLERGEGSWGEGACLLPMHAQLHAVNAKSLQSMTSPSSHLLRDLHVTYLILLPGCSMWQHLFFCKLPGHFKHALLLF